MNAMYTVYTILFVCVLAMHLALKLWLGWRQMRSVARGAAHVPAAFAQTIALADHQKAARYTLAKQRLALVEVALTTLAIVLLTWGGVLQWYADRLLPLAGPGLGFDVCLVAGVVLLQAVLDLPLEWYRRFRIEQHFGFNRMSLAMFAADAAKSAVLGAALGLPVLAIVLWLMRSAGPAWWLGAWLFWSAFSLALSLAYPTVIAPLFNRFTPLPPGALQQRIGALLQRTGFRSNGVFTMDGSRRSSHGNAYFTGLGAGKRIVFYDTLVERLGPDELEAVLAHELGHFRLRHVSKRIASGLILALAWLALLGWLQAQAWFAPSLGVAPAAAVPHDGVVLVLFGLLIGPFTFVLAPLQSALSRRHEFEADAFAAQHTGAPSLVRALVKLYTDNAATLTPDPVHSAFYDSHPPAAVRIERLLARAPASA